MPIRLNIKRDTFVIDLPVGVWVKVRPLNTAIYEMAKAKAFRRSQELLQQSIGASEIGAKLDMGDLPDVTEEDGRAGVTHLLFAQALAQAAVMEWGGVFDADGESEADVNDKNVADLMRVHNMSESFLAQYTEPYLDMVMEGNAFAPAPNGTSAGGAGTVKAAAKTEAPAPAEA